MSNSATSEFDVMPIPPSHLCEADIVFKSESAYAEYLKSISANASLHNGTLLEFDVGNEDCEYDVGAVYVGFDSPKNYEDFLSSVAALGQNDIAVIETGTIKLEDINSMGNEELAEAKSKFYNPDMYI